VQDCVDREFIAKWNIGRSGLAQRLDRAY